MKSWFPWQMMLRVAARRRGFIDPIELLARLRRFAQPSEVQEPIELVRAGVLFHARGLINTKVFQYNLDWVWPYWVVRQFDPADPSFLPRAFSFSHVNLTHRNWTAVGRPGMDEYPIVDPRGLVTLPADPWSLDWWFLPAGDEPLYPSHQDSAEQWLDLERGLQVRTLCTRGELRLETRAAMAAPAKADGPEEIILEACVDSPRKGRLILAARPANPEGVHFIEHVDFGGDGWTVNGRHRVRLAETGDGWRGSTYAQGDLPANLNLRRQEGDHLRCPAGMATAAAVFELPAGESRVVRARVELAPPATRVRGARQNAVRTSDWESALAGSPELVVPEPRWQFLHRAALHTIVLLSPGDIFPGPSTYRRFWFRDACLVMNALLAANRDERVRTALDGFPARQRVDGYFHSQEGEWDANGQVLWIADRYEACTDQRVSDELLRSLAQGARWIGRKRKAGRGEKNAGLLPPGFSAEHLGPVAQYYWDDFWGVAGLRAAARLIARHRGTSAAESVREEAAAFTRDLRTSLSLVPDSVAHAGIPASPHRRMDAGAIGSMVADYPLQLDDVASRPDMFRTAEWLWRHCRYEGGFFQDMIHSGINAYLTLALAQTFMRHGDERHRELIDAVAALASPTGQWPEAIHPRTGGGCMGDGQHTWAAAEWILAMRAIFVREEQNELVLGAGVRPAWLDRRQSLSYGPTNTRWGPVTVVIEPAEGDGWQVKLRAVWHDAPPRIWLAVPGFAPGWAAFADGVAHLQPAMCNR